MNSNDISSAMAWASGKKRSKINVYCAICALSSEIWWFPNVYWRYQTGLVNLNSKNFSAELGTKTRVMFMVAPMKKKLETVDYKSRFPAFINNEIISFGAGGVKSQHLARENCIMCALKIGPRVFHCSRVWCSESYRKSSWIWVDTLKLHGLIF